MKNNTSFTMEGKMYGERNSTHKNTFAENSTGEYNVFYVSPRIVCKNSC